MIQVDDRTKGGRELYLPGAELVALLRNMLDNGRQLRFKVRGASMSPFIKAGDIVTVSPVSRRCLQPGDVVAIDDRRSARLVIHRVIRCRRKGLVVQGDNRHDPDCVVGPENLLGVVTRVERGGNVVVLGHGPERRLIAFLSQWGLLHEMLGVARRLKPHAWSNHR